MINKKKIALFFGFMLLLSLNIYSMTAKEFLAYWIDFMTQKINSNTDWLKNYDDNNLWTKFTLGSKQSEELNSPFGDYIKTKTGLRYRKEDGLTDLSFSTSLSFDSIYSLHENQVNQVKVSFDNVYYPTYYEVLVEHENNIYTCFEEMAKLTYSRARLKVLVTYNENVDDTSNYKFANDILVKNFSSVIKKANSKYPENNETEYVFIIGQVDNNKLIWYSYIFDYKGNIIND